VITPEYIPSLIKEKKSKFPDSARSFSWQAGQSSGSPSLPAFKQIEPLGAWFAERLAEVVSAEGKNLSADVVVPVPLDRLRERERR